MIQQIKDTAAFIRSKNIIEPQIGIILGTGLHNLASKIQIEVILDYSEIPNFPVSTVEFHKGKLIYGTLAGKKIMLMQGRFHYYEGYSMQQVTFPVRVMKELGITQLLISNAAGSMNKNFKKGELMLLDDHINFQPDNPLLGKNIDEQGPRFPDMSQPYNTKMNHLFEKIASEKGIKLNKGVYVSVMGPMLETRAEYRFLRLIGADLVGMSTVPEVIVANHVGIPCSAISVITDECDPDNLKPVFIEEIIEIAGKGDIILSELFEEFIREI